MPYNEVYPLPGNTDLLRDLDRRVGILEARSRVLQNASVIVQDAAGHQQAIIGQLADGTYGIQVANVKLNANGVTAATGSGSVTVDSNGMRVFNAAAQEEVRAGLLNASPAIYGLGVAPATGNPPTTIQQVGGFVWTAPNTATNVNSAAATLFGGANSVQVEVGPSGIAIVTAIANITLLAAGNQGNLLIQVDSGAIQGWAEFQSGSTGTVSAMSSFPLAMSTGQHTVKLYWSTTGNCTFSSPLLMVQPQ